LLLPYPQFTGLTETNLPVGKSWYNSLQVRYDKRLSHGLNLLVSYTHSRWLNATSYLNAQESITQTPDRTLSGTDTPDRIVVSGNWALPIFSFHSGHSPLRSMPVPPSAFSQPPFHLPPQFRELLRQLPALQRPTAPP
jgi:hypothetical protein